MKINRKIIEARIYKCPDDVDTDRIIPAVYLNTTDERELARHCLEGLDSDFYRRVQSMGGRVVVVGGSNFGCGSSREHAVLALRGAGVVAVVAQSFARIFFRNAINRGLLVLECQEANKIPDNDILRIDQDRGIITSSLLKKSFQVTPLPQLLQNILDCGGILNYLVKKLHNIP